MAITLAELPRTIKRFAAALLLGAVAFGLAEAESGPEENSLQEQDQPQMDVGAIQQSQQEQAADDFVEITQAGPVYHNPQTGRILVTGGVRCRFRDISAEGDMLEGNTIQGWVFIWGNVRLEQRGQIVRGGSVSIDTKTREWRMYDAISLLSPEYVKGGITDSVRFSGGEVGADDKIGVLASGDMTTCHLETAHYHLNVGAVRVYPGKKIVIRGATLVGLDRRLFGLRTLVVPLYREAKARVVPDVGQSRDEGVYVKTRYNFLVGENDGALKVDWLQKRGIGLGIEQNYTLLGGAGALLLYHLEDRRLGTSSLSGRITETLRIGRYLVNVVQDERRNSYYYSPNTVSRSSFVTLSHSDSASSVNVSYSENSSESTSRFRTVNTIWNLARKVGSRTTLSLSENYSSSRPGFGDPNDELLSYFKLQHTTPAYRFGLNVDKRSDLDADQNLSDNGVYFLDKLPELTVEAQPELLKRAGAASYLQRASLSVARWSENSSQFESQRFFLDIASPTKRLKLGSESSLDWGMGFRQSYYASDMAQYSISGTINYAFPAERWKLRLSERFQRVRGFTPYRNDFLGKQNVATFGADVANAESYSVNVGTGFDFRNDRSPWQTLAVRVKAKPSQKLSYTLSGGYNLNESFFQQTLLRAKYIGGDNLAEIGLRYDTGRGRIDTLRARLDLEPAEKWRVQSFLEYDGFERQFNVVHLRLTRDLHCWEASFTFSDERSYRSRTEFGLELRIKAFPFSSRFGQSGGGSELDTSIGEGY